MKDYCKEIKKKFLKQCTGKIVIVIVGAAMLLLSCCASNSDGGSSGVSGDFPISSTPVNPNESESTAQDPPASADGQKRPLPETVAQEPLPKTDENGKPYVDTSVSYRFEEGVAVYHPWEQYDLLDTVIKLTEEDLTGTERFIGDQIYCFIDAKGMPGFSAKQPIGDQPAPAVELYLSATDAVAALREGDVIALDGIPMWATGAIQKIYKIHPQVGNVVHITTIAPYPDEFLDMEK